MYPLKQSTAITFPVFIHDVNGDAVTGLVDAGFTKRISKNGAAFAAMTVTITEMENGFYSIPLSTVHSDTLGILTILFTHASAKQANLQFRVHARIPDDLAFPATTGRSIDVTTGGAVGVDWANVEGQGTSVNLSATTTNLVNTATAVTNDVGITATAVSDIWDELLTGGTHNIATSSGRRLRETSDASQVLDSGTAQAGAVGSITLAATADSVNDDIFEDAFVSLLSGTGAGQVRFITAYTASTRVALVHEDWIVVPDSSTVYTVNGSSASDVHAIVDSNAAALNLLADYDGTGFAKANSTIGTTTTNTDMRGTDSALLAASAPTNFGDLSITVTTGLVDITQAAADKTWSTAARALTTGGIGSGVIAAAELNNIADGCLDRRLDLGTDTGGNTTTSRTWRQALRTARNRVAISGGTMTVYEEDDTTSDFTAVITTTVGDPITELNPA